MYTDLSSFSPQKILHASHVIATSNDLKIGVTAFMFKQLILVSKILLNYQELKL